MKRGISVSTARRTRSSCRASELSSVTSATRWACRIRWRRRGPRVAPHRRLMIEAQNASELPPKFWAAYEPDTGTQMLTHPAEIFLGRVEFDSGKGDAVRVWPAGQSAPVVIDPLVRFGTPTVAGIPTEALAEQVPRRRFRRISCGRLQPQPRRRHLSARLRGLGQHEGRVAGTVVPIRYDIDADLLGLARLLVSVRADLTYPGDTGGKGIDGRTRGPCPISTDSKDADWIPEVARRGVDRDQPRPTSAE